MEIIFGAANSDTLSANAGTNRIAAEQRTDTQKAFFRGHRVLSEGIEEAIGSYSVVNSGLSYRSGDEEHELIRTGMLLCQ
ncbi:MAG: hypothetical protein N3G20_10800 [Verrucomicrobiae bacterium]|nr:hypothetical protein [Verrucomicrobiae bacterium]